MSTDLSIESRLSFLEAKVNLSAGDEEPEVIKQTQPYSASISSSVINWITPVDILPLMTINGAWHTLTTTAVPSTASVILFYVEFNNSTGSTTKLRLELRQTSTSTVYSIAASASGASNDTTSSSTQAMAPVGQTFNYQAPTGWLEYVYIVGYMI